MGLNPVMRIPYMLVVGILLLASEAFSGTIALETKRDWQVKDSEIVFRARIVNEGDETAYRIHLGIEMGPVSRATRIEETLPPSGSKVFDFSIPLDDRRRAGSLPLISRLRYQDANGYEFTAIHCDIISFGRPGISRVLGRAENISLSREGDIRVTVKNGYSHAISLRAEIILPDEILCSDPKRDLEMDPNTKADLVFTVENFSALTGSVYWVPVILQYLEGGVGYCTLVPLNLTIAEETGLNLFGQRWLAIALVCLWTGIIVWFQFRKRSRAPRPGTGEIR